jgi:hypothetical protein
MTKRQAENYCWFREKLSEFTDSELDKLHRAETTLNRINTNQCNGYANNRGDWTPLSEEWEAADVKKETALKTRITKLVESKGLKVKYGGDPRGCAIRIYKDGIHNSFDGESCVIDW